MGNHQYSKQSHTHTLTNTHTHVYMIVCYLHVHTVPPNNNEPPGGHKMVVLVQLITNQFTQTLLKFAFNFSSFESIIIL